jgi:hypothetical protein
VTIVGNPFYFMAALYLLLDAIALAMLTLWLADLAPVMPGLGWTRVHLLTIGVVTQAALGTLPSLATAKTGSPAPGPAILWALWLLLNGGLIVLLIGIPTEIPVVTVAGALGIFAAVALMLALLARSGVGRLVAANARWRLLVAAPVFLLAGILLAISLVAGWPAPGGAGGIRESHIHANVWGFFGLLAAGMLIDRVPARAGHPLRFPRVVSPMAWLLIAGATGLVLGPWLGVMPLTLAGLVGYVVGTSLLVGNLIGTIRAARRWTPNLVHLLCAYAWMASPILGAPIVLLLTGRLPIGDVEAVAISSLVTGWILQIAIGAFLPRLREEQDPAGDSNGWWFSVVALNAGVLLTWIGAFTVTVVTVLGFALVLAGWLPPLVDLLRRPVFAFPSGTHSQGA